MLGVFFLVWLVGVVLIIYWAWRNDAVPIDGETSGLFRMRRPAETETETAMRLRGEAEGYGRPIDRGR